MASIYTQSSIAGFRALPEVKHYIGRNEFDRCGLVREGLIGTEAKGRSMEA